MMHSKSYTNWLDLWAKIRNSRKSIPRILDDEEAFSIEEIGLKQVETLVWVDDEESPSIQELEKKLFFPRPPPPIWET